MDAFTHTTGERRTTGGAPACAPTVAAGAGCTAELLAHAARLETLAHKCQDFLLAQLTQLETWLHRCQPGDGGATADGAPDGQTAAWEQTRRDEVRRIEQERTLLADAWQRLESEQRKLLAQRPNVQDSPPLSTRPAKNYGGAAAPQATPVGPRDLPSAGAVEPSRPAVPRELVLVQFEQLKSDVRRHTMQCRRSG